MAASSRAASRRVRKSLSHIRRKLELARQYTRARREAPRLAQAFASLETFCLFVGHPRSGHSLVGSLLDAHPDAVVAHEANALRSLKYGFGREQLFHQLLENSRDQAGRGRVVTGYSYAVPGQWQGRFRALRVIGDKHGDGTAKRLAARPERLGRLRGIVGLPIRWIHVVRNPFDGIATLCARSRRGPDESIDRYLRHARDVERVRGALAPGECLEIRHEAFVRDPAAQLARACAHLGLEAGRDYLRACAAIVFPAPRRTRKAIDWTPGRRARVEAAIERYGFLSGYTPEV